ncbi:MAG TPA: hypothetical protein PKE40_00475 [Arachnia sp.]|nr:hypothetical protein [Arachnia sp.]HMT84800.1 hypothetical protein [Arachnia sp.]
MSLLLEYETARREEDLARLRRVIALRALIATGATQHLLGLMNLHGVVVTADAIHTQTETAHWCIPLLRVPMTS